MKFEFAFTQLPYFLKPLSRLAVCVALFMSGFLLTPTSMVLADDTTGSGSSNSSSNGDGQQATVERSNGTALRAAVHNGVVKIINNTLQADVDLFFDALPVSKTRLASLASMAELPESFKFSIKNEDLGKADPTLWDFGIDSTTADRRKGLLKDALAMSSFDKAGLQNRQFLTKWTSFKGAYPNAIRNLASADYYGLLFDGSKLNILLSSTEARLAVRSERSDVKVAFFDAKGNEIKSAKGDLANGLILSEGIVWKITAFPQKVADVINPETKTPETLYYCRFGITATMPTLRITANKDAGQDVKLETAIGFKDSGLVIRNLMLTEKNVTVNVPPVVKDELAQLEAAGEPNSLELALKNVGGVGLDDLVLKGLLGGTERSSIVTGGLIGKGKVGQLIGVNMERNQKGSVTPGLLVGVDPGGDNSTYAGLSVRSGVFLASVGVRAYEKTKNGSTDKSTKAGLAGVVSVDLSRLTRQKKDRQFISLANDETGGDWGKNAGLLSQGMSLLSVDITNPFSSDAEIMKGSLVFEQVKDAEDKPIPEDGKKVIFAIPLNVDRFQQRYFLPSGLYLMRFEGNGTSKLNFGTMGFEGMEVQGDKTFCRVGSMNTGSAAKFTIGKSQ